VSGFTLAQAAVSSKWEEGLPCCKHAPFHRSRGKHSSSDAGEPVPAPRSPHARRIRRNRAVLITPSPHMYTRNGHCSCSRCSGRCPSRATIRAETQSILHSRRISKLLALVGYCSLHVCADAQGRTNDSAPGPPAAAAAAPSQTAAPGRPVPTTVPTTSDARIAAVIAAASMSSETVWRHSDVLRLSGKLTGR
jgi:hypothetical protein